MNSPLKSTMNPRKSFSLFTYIRLSTGEPCLGIITRQLAQPKLKTTQQHARSLTNVYVKRCEKLLGAAVSKKVPSVTVENCMTLASVYGPEKDWTKKHIISCFVGRRKFILKAPEHNMVVHCWELSSCWKYKPTNVVDALERVYEKTYGRDETGENAKMFVLIPN